MARVARILTLVALVLFGLFYVMLAIGAATLVDDCETVICGQLHQAVFASVGALSLFAAAYRFLKRQSSTAKLVFFGTLPILIVHVIAASLDPNESIFFPLSTAPPPAVSGATLLYRVKR